MTKLSIIIVNYNSGKHLLDCLESIESLEDEADIYTYVVDNASVDSSATEAKKKFSWAQFILNRENLGFGKANNQILKKVDTEYILLLNPDAILEEGVIKKMISFMNKNKDVGAATCKVVHENGEIDWATHRGFPTPWASFLYMLGNDKLYHLTENDLSQLHEVDAISGAFFLTRKSIIEEVGVFDEDYFMYAEDIDLCFRIKQAGYKVMYVPDVQIVHLKGVSSGLKKHSQGITTANLETKKRSLNAFYKTMKIFYKKHYEKKYFFLINWLVYLGIDIKWWLAKRKLTV